MKKIIVLVIGIFFIIGLISYNVYANESGLNSSKNLVKNINKVSDDNLDESIKKTKEYKDDFLKVNISKFESKDVSVECDEDGNPILIENKIKKDEIINMTAKSPKKKKIYTDDKLFKKATQLVEKLNNTKKNKDELIYLGQSTIMDGTIAFKWARALNGYEYESDFYMVVLDPSDCELVVATKICISDNPDNRIKLKEEEAINIATEIIKVNQDQVLGCKVKIVNPNYYWSNFNGEQNRETKFAYEVVFNKKPNNESKEEVFVVWIDAENGEELGGYETK